MRIIRDMGHKQAFRRSNRMFSVGLLVAVAGLALGWLCPYGVWKHLLFIPGFIAAAAGYGLSLKKVRCPRCGGYPGEMPRMLSRIPNYCPHCGEPL